MFKKIVQRDDGQIDKKKCGNFLVLVPHPLMVDMDKVASAIGLSIDDIKKVSVKECHATSGFPIFVCPPIGHEFSLPVKERQAMEKKREEEQQKEKEQKEQEQKKENNDSNMSEDKEKNVEDNNMSEEANENKNDDSSMQVDKIPVFDFKPKSITLPTNEKVNNFGDKKEKMFVIFDSSLVDCDRKLLFDCGQSAVIFTSCQDMVRATGGHAIEALATTAPPS